MPRRLLTVEDLFAITGRGTVVAPHVAADPAWPAAVRRWMSSREENPR